MDTEEICKLIILGIVLFGIYHFFIRKSPRDERKDVERKELELPTPPTPPPSPPPIPQVKPSTDERKIEVHFVYAEWCGHSRKALPDFQKLVNEKGVKTIAGIPLEFVMTDESSPNMEQFKDKIQGFPTYMALYKENGTVIKVEEVSVPNRTADGIRSAARVLPGKLQPAQPPAQPPAPPPTQPPAQPPAQPAQPPE